MKIFFLRLSFILTIVFFEFSFFDVLFPQVSVPIIIVASIVALTLLSGFPRALSMVIPLALCFDIVSSGGIGMLAPYAVMLSYATSFLSRRLLIEHSGLGMALYAGFAACGTFGYAVFAAVSSQGDPFSWTPEIAMLLLSATLSAGLLFSCLLSVALFAVVYRVAGRFDRYVGSIAQGDALQMK